VTGCHYTPQTTDHAQHTISISDLHILILNDIDVLCVNKSHKTYSINPPLSIWNDDAYVRVSPIYIIDVATISHIAGGKSTNGLNERFPFKSFISSWDPS
jgi:hypothetical protein